MRTSRIAGLVLLATATLAQQQTVELTSEPHHHLVFENQYVRVFDVTVAPKDTTLVHRHNHDYLFVTLGDADVINARVGEKPTPLRLKDGEVRFTPGNFAHAAANESDRPFHNITIELLQPSSTVTTCTEGCLTRVPCTDRKNASCPSTEKRISSDQWTASLVIMSPASCLKKHTHSIPHLVIAVSSLDLTSQSESASTNIMRDPGGLAWVPSGVTHTLTNSSRQNARFVTLEFKADKP